MMKTDELRKLIEENPTHLSVRQVARFLGCSEEGLRASMEQNHCPFGFSWRLGARSSYKIPTITFALWVTKGAVDLGI